MYNLLIPTDFSENARKAANYALWLFQGQKVNLILFNAYGTSRSEGSMLISIDDILKKDADKEMAKEIERVEELASPGIKINGFTRNCTLISYIAEVCDDWNIDLIILGTKGETGLRGKVFGSNATNVIHKVSVPVLAVPESALLDDNGQYNIALGTDLKPFKGRELLSRLVLELDSDIRQVQFEIFYITPEPSEIDPKVKVYFDNIGGDEENTYVNIVDKDIASGLDQYIQKRKPDLMLLVHRRDSFINRLMGNSISQSMLLKAEIPLLVFHDM